jgi:tRNA pseudouridine55 synthase
MSGDGGRLTALPRTRVGRFGLDQARTLDELADEPRLSHSLDKACLLSFPRRDLSADEAESARHGRALEPAGIEGVYAATAPDGQVIALLKDLASQTKSVVVFRTATLSRCFTNLAA